LPPTPTLNSSPTRFTELRQVELVEHLGISVPIRCSLLGLAIDQAAEQDVVLQGRDAVVALEIVELDGAAQRAGRLRQRHAALPADALPLPHRPAPAMAGLDIAERQGHQARPVGFRHRIDALAAQALQQQPDIGQLVGRDEAVLLEQRVVGRRPENSSTMVSAMVEAMRCSSRSRPVAFRTDCM